MLVMFAPRFSVLLLGLGLALLPASGALAGGTEGLRRAVEQGLANSPQVKGAEADYAAAYERYAQTKAAMLPEISLDASHTHKRTDWEGGRAKTDPTAVDLSLTQTLFDWRVVEGYRQADPYVKAYAMDLEETRQSLIYQVADVYFGLLEAKEVAGLAQNNRNVTRRHLEATQARFEAGELTRTDVSQAEARLATAEASLIQANNDVAVGRAEYLEVVGVPPGEDHGWPEILTEEEKKELETLLASVDERPDMQALAYRLQVADKDLLLEKAEHLPTVVMTASSGRSWDSETSGRDDPIDSYQMKVTLSVPVFSGFDTTSQIDQARAERDASRHGVDQARREAVREIEEAQLNLNSALAAHVAYQASVRAAETALEGVQEEFQVGSRTALDVLDAQNELFDVQTDLAKSRFSILLKRVALLQAVGSLTPDKF